MGFSLSEARAGHALAERDVATAQAALAAAGGRRERRQAEANLEHARSILELSATMLRKVEREIGPERAGRGPQGNAPAPRHPAEPSTQRRNEGPKFADHMSMDDALQTVRTFGERRQHQGDQFVESPHLPGAFFYETGEARTGVRVWGEQDDWAMSVFSAARVGMQPTYELYRYISKWRTTNGLGAPYVVEDGARAAVMCERSFQSSQLASDTTAWRLIASTIDLIGHSSTAIARSLDRADGVAFTAQAEVGLTLLLGWWEINDEHIASVAHQPS